MSFKECSLPVSLPVTTTSTRVCNGYCTPSCTGLTYLSESCMSSVSSFLAASMVNFHSIWLTTVYRSPMWHHGSTFIQPVDVYWSYCVTISACMAAGLLLWLARRSGTLSPTLCEIWILPWTTSSIRWKRFYFQRTSPISALNMLWWWDVEILLTYIDVSFFLIICPLPICICMHFVVEQMTAWCKSSSSQGHSSDSCGRKWGNLVKQVLCTLLTCGSWLAATYHRRTCARLHASVVTRTL